MEPDFKTLCEQTAEVVGIEVTFYDEDEALNDAFEDDGTLHVQNGLLRACFDVSNSQNDRPSVQNEKTEEVLRLLGLEPSSRTLVKDEEDEDEWDDEDEEDDEEDDE